MSARSESAAPAAPCACTNISLIQLFHELKQKFPGVPDHVVSTTIELYCHDKRACESHLLREAKACLPHAYHASSSAAAAARSPGPAAAPAHCPNRQPLALTSTPELIDRDEPTANTDNNQNWVEDEKYVKVNENNNNITSPVTIVNIDNCIAKYTAESPSDLELTDASVTEREETLQEEPERQGSINYRILKSNKIRSCLNEKLEKGKEKKTIKKDETGPFQNQEKEEQKSLSPQPQNVEKPKRPNTLEFLQPSPGIAFNEPPQEPPEDPFKAISPAPPLKPQATDTTPGGGHRPANYPLNLSVNVNCHMDYARPYDPWLEDYDSPRAVTSVNLTVCTPTSNMGSPVREAQDEDGGFEGHVTVTVSPSAGRAPRRRAPAPPGSPSAVEPSHEGGGAECGAECGAEGGLVARQRARLARLAAALAGQRARVVQLQRERDILRRPPAPPAAARALQAAVRRLRAHCDLLARRLERAGTEPESAAFYRHTNAERPRPARPAPPPPAAPAPAPAPAAAGEEGEGWECGVCTFRNHGLLDKCEACEMPHIVIGTSPSASPSASPARTLDSGFGSFRERGRGRGGEASCAAAAVARAAAATGRASV